MLVPVDFIIMNDHSGRVTPDPSSNLVGRKFAGVRNMMGTCSGGARILLLKFPWKNMYFLMGQANSCGQTLFVGVLCLTDLGSGLGDLHWNCSAVTRALVTKL